MRKYFFGLLLLVIIIGASFLRCFKLGLVPPSLSWDEAAVGYNAFTIANWSRDEWGYKFPLVFKSFEDFKHPVHIYTTSLFVKFLGLSEFSTRLPSAVFGVGNIILIYLLGKELFKNRTVGLIASAILAISPYNLQFSRFNHELNFVLFFFMLGLICFFKSLGCNRKLLPLSFLILGICLYTYHSAKIVAFPLTLLLVLLYLRNLVKVKWDFIRGLIIYGIILLGLVLNSQLLGLARIKQTSFQVRNFPERIAIIGRQYLWHFSSEYLFLTGDKNSRHSTQVVGEFYKTDSIFLMLGFLILAGELITKKKKENLFLLSWALLAPLPSALVNEAPHAARAMFMIGSWHLIAACGLYRFLFFFKKKYLWILPLLVIFSLYFFEFWRYAKYYFGEYPVRYGIDWQYGMKQVVEEAGENDYYSVFATDVRSQPYIFFLYYLKTPLPEFLRTVEYNTTASRSHSLVKSFGKYTFADWDPIEAIPDDTGLYAVTPSEYSGLRNKGGFAKAEAVLFPNGLDAFYLVSGKKSLEY